MSWENLPDINEVRHNLLQLSRAKSRLRALELELKILQADINKQAPRNTAARVVGIDDNTRERLITLQRSIVNAEDQVDILEAEIAFNEYRKDMLKILSWKGRL